MATRGFSDREAVVVSAGIKTISEQLADTANSQTSEKISCRDLSAMEQIAGTNVTSENETEATTAAGRRREAIKQARLKMEAAARNNNLEKLENRDINGDGFIGGDPLFGGREVNQEDILREALSNLDDVFPEIEQTELFVSPESLIGLTKTNLTINREDFGGSATKLNDDFSIEKPVVVDHVKYFNGAMYTVGENSALAQFHYSSKKKYIDIGPLEYRGEPLNRDDVNLNQIQEIYSFSFNRENLSRITAEFKNKFIRGGSFTGSIGSEPKATFDFSPMTDSTVRFNDSTYVMATPFENSETLENIDIIGASIIDAVPDYRFYIKQYEKIATKGSVNVSEATLPNLYILSILAESKDPDNLLLDIVSLHGSIKDAKKFALNKNDKEMKNVSAAKVLLGERTTIGQYFDNFGSKYSTLQKRYPDLLKTYAEKNRNLIYTMAAIKQMDTYNDKKYMFPMSVEFNIPTDKTTNITKALIDSELMDSFMLYLFKTNEKNAFTLTENVVTAQLIDQDIKNGNIKKSSNTKKGSAKVFKFSDIINNITSEPIPAKKDNYIMVGDTSDTLRSNSDSLKFINSIRSLVLQGKLQSFMRRNMRTYKEILNGKKAYNETVAFRVAKFVKGAAQPIQNMWFPNNPDLDVINLIDTQVKYEQEYEYKIYAYQFILGSDYQHTARSDLGSTNNFILTVNMNVAPIISEVELLTVTRKVVDTPPLSPEITFVPYRGVDNKIGLFLNGRVGTEKLEPIAILENDQEKIDTYVKNSKGLVIYKADDVARRFEILKMVDKPKSYSDFKNGFIKIAETDVSLSSIQSATAAAFIDDIEPNKKYYYTFRTVDVHEKISNPTIIYEVELINQNGLVLPIINEYNFEKPKFVNKKEMRRYIKIEPAIQHTILNKEKTGIADLNTAQDALKTATLGVSDVASPWDRTYKMVVTSKQTGKKVEVKFKFKYVTKQSELL